MIIFVGDEVGSYFNVVSAERTWKERLNRNKRTDVLLWSRCVIGVRDKSESRCGDQTI